MKHQDGFFSNQENQSIYYQNWLPDESARAVLLIVHGLNEHCGRYQHLAEYFTDKSFAVYGLDQIGHGKSEGTRAYLNSFSEFTDTLLEYIKMIKERQPELPIFLVGHSLGGLIGAKLLIDHPHQIEGAILSGSLVLIPENISPLTIRIGKIVANIFPKLGLAGVDPYGLSRDPDVVQAYIDDPLVYSGKATTILSVKINETMEIIAAQGKQINQPLLILHGGEDQIVPPASSQFLYDLVSSVDKKLVFYDGFYHEIYNEPGHEEIFEDILSWLQNRLT